MNQPSTLIDAELPFLEAQEPSETRRRLTQSSSPSRGHHWVMLSLAILVIVLAFLLQTRGSERVAMQGVLLPPTCVSRAVFGINCPGCGLTRSFIHLAHGDWHAAWQMHRLGWLLAFATVAQIPYRAAALRWPTRRLLGEVFPMVFGYSLIGLLLCNWILERVLSVAP
jgi:hypothetical protein